MRDTVGEDDTMFAGRPMTRGDEALIVRFWLKPCRVKWKTDDKGEPVLDAHQQMVPLEGRPVFVDKPYVSIKRAGDRFQEIMAPARERHKRRFPDQWKAFEAGHDQVHVGTPLAEWPLVPRSQVEELRYFNIHTVEQLAAVSDGAILQVGPISALKARAIDWLERARDGEADARLRSEIERKDEQLRTMQAQLDAQREAMDRIAARLDATDEPRAPGMPPPPPRAKRSKSEEI